MDALRDKRGHLLVKERASRALNSAAHMVSLRWSSLARPPRSSSAENSYFDSSVVGEGFVRRSHSFISFILARRSRTKDLQTRGCAFL